MVDSISQLYDAVQAARGRDPATSRTARLLEAGVPKASKKLAEEAVEVVLEAMDNRPSGVVRESADLLYNLVVLWSVSGVKPEDVWAEMQGREQRMGIAEKLPKRESLQSPVPGVVSLAARRGGKRTR